MHVNLSDKDISGVLSSVDIMLTHRCNLNCPNCCTHSNIPSNNQLSLEQLDHFLSDAIEWSIPWRRWNITGGEPTLYPQWDEFITLLTHYHNLKPSQEIYLYTNATIPLSIERIRRLPKWLKPQISHKDDITLSGFSLMNIAPQDLDGWDSDNITPCEITSRCGMALSWMGIYPCSPAGGIANVIGGPPGVQCLGDVNRKTLAPLYGLCSLCGFYVCPKHAKSPMRYNDKKSLDYMSPTWYDVYQKGGHVDGNSRG